MRRGHSRQPSTAVESEAQMNVIPGSSFFQTVSGSAANRPHGAAQILQAQSVENGRSAAPPERDDAASRPRSVPYGPRGSLIDIIA